MVRRTEFVFLKPGFPFTPCRILSYLCGKPGPATAEAPSAKIPPLIGLIQKLNLSSVLIAERSTSELILKAALWIARIDDQESHGSSVGSSIN